MFTLQQFFASNDPATNRAIRCSWIIPSIPSGVFDATAGAGTGPWIEPINFGFIFGSTWSLNINFLSVFQCNSIAITPTCQSYVFISSSKSWIGRIADLVAGSFRSYPSASFYYIRPVFSSLDFNLVRVVLVNNGSVYPKDFHPANRALHHDSRLSPKGTQKKVKVSLPDRSIDFSL